MERILKTRWRLLKFWFFKNHFDLFKAQSTVVALVMKGEGGGEREEEIQWASQTNINSFPDFANNFIIMNIRAMHTVRTL